MSFFRDVLGGIGDLAKKAAPITAFIPGVGPLAAAGIGAAGGALGELNDEDPSFGHALQSAAIGGGLGYAGGKIADAGVGNVIKSMTSTPERAFLTAQGLSTAANAYGAHEMGRIEDEERERRRRRAEALLPRVNELMQRLDRY